MSTTTRGLSHALRIQFPNVQSTGAVPGLAWCWQWIWATTAEATLQPFSPEATSLVAEDDAEDEEAFTEEDLVDYEGTEDDGYTLMMKRWKL